MLNQVFTYWRANVTCYKNLRVTQFDGLEMVRTFASVYVVKLGVISYNFYQLN